MSKGKLSVVVGGQFGSEAKGAVTAWLTRKALLYRRTVVVRVAGPNAGHTAYDRRGRAWALRQVPVGMVVDRSVIGVIADGSEVDLPVLLDEMRQLDAAGLDVSSRLFISGHASILTEAHHKREEKAGIHGRIGSTGKGIGECRADRLMRRVQTLGQAMMEALGQEMDGRGLAWEHLRKVHYPATPIEAMNVDDWDGFKFNLMREGTASWLCRDLEAGSHVIIEGTQGYGLGLHQRHYPQCTSSDTRAIDFLAMAGVNPWGPGVDEFEVWVVVRAYPIRVAGNSGTLKNETTWEELGLPVELTTVTKKPRRVGRWDQALFDEAVKANGGPGVVKVAFSMADQEFSELAGWTGVVSWANELPEDADADERKRSDALDDINVRTHGLVHYVGTGPDSCIEVI